MATASRIAVSLLVVLTVLLVLEAWLDCRAKRDLGYEFFLFPPGGCVQIEE